MSNSSKKYTITAAVICALFAAAAVTILSVFFIDRSPVRPDTAIPQTQDIDTAVSSGDADSITVMMAGDMLIHKAVYSQASTGHNSYDLAPYFSEVGGIFSGDLNIVAFKCPIDARGRNSMVDTSPSFNAPIESLDVLSSLGADVCITSGSHSFDKGTKGMKATLENIRDHSITPVGTYADKDERSKPCIIRRGDFDIGILAYSVNEQSAASSARGEYMINWISGKPDCADDIASDISDIRAAGAQFVIVSIEWGTEYRSAPSDEQRELARLICEGGADVIMGTYPKCVQPVERISVTRSDGSEHECLIAYSIGSFFCYTARHSDKSSGAVFGFDIVHGDDGSAVLGDVFCIPLYLYCSGKDGADAFRLLPAGKFAKASERPDIFPDDESFERCISAWDRTCAAVGDDVQIFDSPEALAAR